MSDLDNSSQPWTELHTRIVGVMENIGALATAKEIQQRGNIPKPLQFIERVLDDLQKRREIMQRGDQWLLAKKKAEPAGMQNPTPTIGSRPAAAIRKTMNKELNRKRVFEHLDAHPDATLEELHAATGLSQPTITKYRNYWRREQQRKSEAPGVNQQENNQPTTLAEIEDEIMKEKHGDQVVIEALSRIGKTQAADAPERLNIKLTVLTRLAELYEESISEVLREIAYDLIYLNTLVSDAPVQQ